MVAENGSYSNAMRFYEVGSATNLRALELHRRYPFHLLTNPAVTGWHGDIKLR